MTEKSYIMIWINNRTWSHYKFATIFNFVFIWKRWYKKRYGVKFRWTPIIYLKIKRIKK